jgi:hypothetical protein
MHDRGDEKYIFHIFSPWAISLHNRTDYLCQVETNGLRQWLTIDPFQSLILVLVLSLWHTLPVQPPPPTPRPALADARAPRSPAFANAQTQTNNRRENKEGMRDNNFSRFVWDIKQIRRYSTQKLHV